MARRTHIYAVDWCVYKFYELIWKRLEGRFFVSIDPCWNQKWIEGSKLLITALCIQTVSVPVYVDENSRRQLCLEYIYIIIVLIPWKC